MSLKLELDGAAYDQLVKVPPPLLPANKVKWILDESIIKNNYWEFAFKFALVS